MAGLPLARYRVLDFGTNIAGPMAAQLLADMGAQVVKIESREKLDGLRMGRPVIGDDVVFEPEDHNFFRERREKGPRTAFHERDRRFEAPARDDPEA